MGKPEYPDFNFRKAINFDIGFPENTRMAGKIGRSTLSDEIFHTAVKTFVIILRILVHLVLNQ